MAKRNGSLILPLVSMQPMLAMVMKRRPKKVHLRKSPLSGHPQISFVTPLQRRLLETSLTFLRLMLSSSLLINSDSQCLTAIATIVSTCLSNLPSLVTRTERHQLLQCFPSLPQHLLFTQLALSTQILPTPNNI